MSAPSKERGCTLAEVVAPGDAVRWLEVAATRRRCPRWWQALQSVWATTVLGFTDSKAMEELENEMELA